MLAIKFCQSITDAVAWRSRSIILGTSFTCRRNLLSMPASMPAAGIGLPLKGNFVLFPGLGCNHSPSQLVHPDVDTLVDSLLVALSSRHE